MITREMVVVGAKLYKVADQIVKYEVLKVEIDNLTKKPWIAYVVHCNGSSSKIDTIYLSDNTIDGLNKWFTDLADAYEEKSKQFSRLARSYKKSADEIRSGK